MTTQRVTFPVVGLSCGGGGALTIERALARLPGVVRAYVNPATEMAYLEFDPSQSNPERMKTVVEKLGFQVGEMAVR